MILITGASGFIGKRLLAEIKKSYPNERVFSLNERANNLVTKKAFDNVPKNPRLVFHLAAATDTSNPDQRCNDIGTKNLIDHLEMGPKAHLIFTSSEAIFSGRKKCNKPIDSRTKPKPSNSYGKTKLTAERVLLKAAREKGFKLTIVRLPTVWGNNPRKNSFFNFLKGFIRNNSLVSRLNYPGKIGLISRNDAVRFILKSSTKPSKIVSIAAQNLTLAEIFEILTRQEGKEYKPINFPALVWKLGQSLRPHISTFERFLPATVYNYLWRASIVIDNPLWCEENVRGQKLTS